VLVISVVVDIINIVVVVVFFASIVVFTVVVEVLVEGILGDFILVLFITFVLKGNVTNLTILNLLVLICKVVIASGFRPTFEDVDVVIAEISFSHNIPV
jgi:hypothetical protein